MKRTIVVSATTWTALLLASGVARPLSALQTGPETAGDSLPDPRVGCVQGDPLPRCATFWLFEMQGSTTLVEPTWIEPTPSGGTAAATADEKLVEWTVGHMWNTSTTWAFGGTVSLGNNADGGFTGARLRVRRWLGPGLSVSVETGLARSTARPGTFRTGHGPSAGLRFEADDRVAMFLRYDRIGVVRNPYAPSDVTTSDPHEYLRLGVGLGGKAALVGTGAVAVGAVIVAAIIGYSLRGAT